MLYINVRITAVLQPFPAQYSSSAGVPWYQYITSYLDGVRVSNVTLEPKPIGPVPAEVTGSPRRPEIKWL